jgi:hypothetical protein
LLRVSEVGSTPVTLPQARTPIDPVPAILYETGDETARGLAERIIALGAMDSCSADAALLAEAVPNMKSSIRAKGVDPITFRDALASGQFFGYVVPLSWNADYPTVTSQLMERAGWAVMPGLSLRGSSVSLVETRAHFVAISDRIGYLNDHNGGVRVLGGTSVTVR